MAVFRLDPCGVICVLVTYFSLAYADYVILAWVLQPFWQDSLLGAFHAVVFNTLLAAVLVSHGRAMLADPGLVPLPAVRDVRTVDDYVYSSDDSESELENQQFVGAEWSVCGRCEAYRPPRAHHCRICKRCIRQMHHHCPWINNCVGEYNQKYFLQFLFYAGIAALYCILIVLTSFFTHWRQSGTEQMKRGVLHVIFVSVECVMFILFIVAVLHDQLSSIFYDQSPIDKLQKRNRFVMNGVSKLAMIRRVFGQRSVALWLLPCFGTPTHREIVRFPSTYTL